MDFVTQQFIAVKKNLLATLEKISSQIEAATSEYRAHSTHNHAPQLLTAELRRPQSEIDNEETRQARKETRDRQRLTVEVVGIALASIVVFANIFLWIETRKAVRVAAVSADAAQLAQKHRRPKRKHRKVPSRPRLSNFNWISQLG
jgi:hypothetical protein